MGGKIKVVQHERGAKASSDSILLASVVTAREIGKNGRVLDVGTGSGAVAMAMLWRLPSAFITGVDAHDEMAELARLSAEENGFEGRFEARLEDITKQSAEFRRLEFDAVVTNPPYHSGAMSSDELRAAARSKSVSVDEWIRGCVARLCTGGVFAIINKVENMAEIVTSMVRLKMGKIEIFPIASKTGEAAKRVIIRGIKGSRAPAKLHPYIVMHEPIGGFSPAAIMILEEGRDIMAVIEALAEEGL